MTNFESESRQGHTGSLRRRIWLASVVGGSLVVGLTAGIVMVGVGDAERSGSQWGDDSAHYSKRSSIWSLGRWEWLVGNTDQASGKVASVTPSAIENLTSPDGSATRISIDSSTMFEQRTSASASAIKPGNVVLAYGPRQNSTINASTLVFWKSAASPSPSHGGGSGAWGSGAWGSGAWGSVQGWVQSVANSSIQVTSTSGTSTTISIGADTNLLSSTSVASDAISAGNDVYVVDSASATGVAKLVVVANHTLTLCPWSSTSTSAGSNS